MAVSDNNGVDYENNSKVEKLIAMANDGETIRILGMGESMRPLIHGGRDYIYFRALQTGEKYAVGDVVLYKPADKYIMHRIAKISKKGYEMLGDGNQFIETPIPESMIYLRAIGFKRNGKYISVQNKLYRVYAFWWMKLWRIRPFVRKTKGFINIFTGHGR